MFHKTLILLFSLTLMYGCATQKNVNRVSVFPVKTSIPAHIPDRDAVWVFLLAGQSNMAGRAVIEPKDTVPNERIFSINKNGEPVLAKEPLHFYEPGMAGLDCGLSFGKELLKHIPRDVSILLLPTAVGGSAIGQWIHDSTFRNVALFSNFREKVKLGQQYGIIKGILWHQGENDATTTEQIRAYQGGLTILLQQFRKETGNPSLPVLMGELGSFSEDNDGWQAINQQIHAYAATDNYARVISTKDLRHKGDKVHFNSKGQRLLGKRFAKAFIRLSE